MSLGIPMQLEEINGLAARCKRVEREVSLFTPRDDNIAVGDFAMVHVDYAMQQMDVVYTKSTWELIDEMLTVEGSDA